MDHLERAVAEGGSGNSSVVVDLEKAFAAFTEAQFALCVASGTSALIAACRAVGVRSGDLVGVSALGPVMSGQAILALGAQPVFLDSASESSFGISAASAAEATERGIFHELGYFRMALNVGHPKLDQAIARLAAAHAGA